MRRLIAAAALSVIIITSYFTGSYIINDACRKANEKLEEVVNVYETDKDATNKAKELEDYWSKKEKHLSFIANHSTIDDIELAISSLVVYSSTPDNKIFYEYSGNVKTLLHQLIEDTKASVHSIF